MQSDTLSVPHDVAGLSSSMSARSAFEMGLQFVHPKHGLLPCVRSTLHLSNLELCKVLQQAVATV